MEQQTIRIKYHSNEIEKLTYIDGKSDWIDLRSAEHVVLKKGEFKLIKLGVSMQLPAGYEAVIVPRSSTYKNFGIIQTNQYTLTQFVDIHGAINGDGIMTIMPALLALLGFLIIVVLQKLNVKGNVIIGILATTVLYYVVTGTVPSFDIAQIGQSFKDFADVGITAVFKGASWEHAFSPAFVGGVFSAIMYIVTFCLVDMFDTIGTLYGTASQAGMLDENGDPEDLDKCMACDSIATVTGAVLGTSTCTTFVESASGVAAGGRRTDKSGCICMLLCMSVPYTACKHSSKLCNGSCFNICRCTDVRKLQEC